LRGGLILAGGLSTRMGVRKSLLTLDGEPFVVIIVKTLLKVVDEIIVALGSEDEPYTHSKFLPSSVKVVKDEVEGQSPLLGIVTGLSKMCSTYSIVLPCDLPFAKPDVMKYLFEKAEGFDAVIPRWPEGDIEPLHAIYRVDTALQAARAALQAGGLKNTDMIERLKRVNYVNMSEFRQFDPELLCFFNINTPQDLDRARRIASKHRLWHTSL
jgi:molybdopterin-guanine dinucleotide biosynthesis protein A